MEIVKATPFDLIEVMYLLRVCIQDMNEKGMTQWNNAYPDGRLMQRKIDDGSIYLIKDKGVCKGMISISDKTPDDYKSLLNGDQIKSIFLQWLAVHPIWQGQGIAKELIDYAENFAKTNGFKSIKLDVFSEDTANQIVLKKNYTEIGKFHSSFQRVPFVCYEKTLN